MKISWLYFKNNSLSPIILVIIQFSCIFYILFTTGFYPDSIPAFGIYLSGIFLGLWSIWVMKEGKLNVSPDPMPGFRIIEKGPYRIIRHPMYLAIIFTLSPLLFENFQTNAAVTFGILIINLNIKLIYEENQISHQIPEYYDYKKRTWRLIPLLY